MPLRKLEMPKKLEWDKDHATERYGRFTAEPFERGYGHTMGNSLRRILLSSIQGAAITHVKITGVSHEFTSIPGVVEDVSEIILNLKGVKMKVSGEVPRKMYLSVSGERTVTPRDFQQEDEVEIVNPDHHIATLTSKSARLDMEVEVDMGRGYQPAEKHRQEDLPEGVIPIDAVFTPVTKVAYRVENTRVGQITDYERLIMEIWTDGRIRPEDALAYAAQIQRDHLAIFVGLEESTVPEEEVLPDQHAEHLRHLLSKSVEELELSVRAANCLKIAGIKSLYELVQKSESEMLKFRNFGRKSLNEIRDILSGMGLSFGMKIDPKVHELMKVGVSSKGDSSSPASATEPAPSRS